MGTQLQEHLRKLAMEHPELRAHIVPLLRAAAQKTAHGPISMKSPDVMLYLVDVESNMSKFYEMGVVPKGMETPAKSTKDFSNGLPRFVLMKRWGRLTDNGASGRIDSVNETYGAEHEAMRNMMAWRTEKVRKGYQDVSMKQQYPIGLGGAGFGWGGQAACTYVPELRSLNSQLSDLMGQLLGMQRVVKTLKDRKSGMADALAEHILNLTNSAGGLSEYLNDQLASCR